MPRKYEPLATFLEGQSGPALTIGFAEIEEIVGKLPASAWEHPAWWANSVSHVEAKDGWIAAGWEVGAVDQAKGVVTFRRR